MNAEDISLWLNLITERLNGNQLRYSYHIVNLVIVLLFFFISELNVAKSLGKVNYPQCLLMSIIGSVFGSVLLIFLGKEAILFSHIVGCLIALFVYKKIGGKLLGNKSPDDEDDEDEDKDDNKKDSDTNSNKNSQAINITINNDSDGVTNTGGGVNKMSINNEIPNNLDIITILENYGYISANQKYKMISSSLFETPDEMVEKLLEMVVLEPRELKEAKAILNLIRMERRLVTKEEALKFIIEYEKRVKNNDSSQ